MFITKNGVVGDIRGEIHRLESLLADLRRIADGSRPNAADLADAPIIDQWTAAMRPEPCLVGKIHGHPRCKGSVSVTSGVWMHAPELGWMRTLSSYYRLGRPLGQDKEPLQ